jgi:hypothetical protein
MAQASAHLSAEERVGQNGVGVVAMTKRDELEAVDGDHVT